MPLSKYHQTHMANAVASQNLAFELARLNQQNAGRIDVFEQKLDQIVVAHNDLAQVVLRNDALDAIERRINDAQEGKINAIVDRFGKAFKALDARVAKLETQADPRSAWSYVGLFLGTAVNADGSLIRAQDIAQPYVKAGLSSLEDIRNAVGPRGGGLGALLARLQEADPDNAPNELELKSLITTLHAIGPTGGQSTTSSASS